MVRERGVLESDGFHTYYEIQRPAVQDSVPLILLAGGPGLPYKALAPLFDLAHDREVVGYDQIGSGRSTRSDQFPSLYMNDFIKQFHDVITELGIEEFHLLGHSWGTILGLNIALEYPEQTKSLIIHSGVADWQACLKSRATFQEEHLPDRLTKMVDKVKAGSELSEEERNKYLKEWNNLFYCRVEYPEYLKQALDDKDVTTNQLIWDPEKNKEMTDYSMTDRLSGITCPTLIISGAFDGISVGQAALFKKGIQDSRHVEFQHSAHYAHVEEEERFLRVVEGFLKEVDGY
ncbi:alpha/beta fold hydrolase [Halobacillus litoralis]|uniref:alpha/beta fold hydrolase n=1 Tax=Halobacillus litoralis TaxID=45668 RepID=UPI001CD5ABC4|nr:alpha/beta fold hydrolase [Halobacillus litoralis]MCA0970856.1 alpha/beta fold hydrolase [Halobacillus litoralis]